MPEQANKRKDIKKYIRRKKIRKVISFIIVTFLCIYIPTVIILATSSKPNLDMIKNGEIKDYIKADGIVLKEEQVYYSQFKGVFAKGAIEGEKVPAGYTIATIVNEDYMDLFNQLENLKKEILIRKQSGEINSGIFTRDLKDIEDNIKKSVSEITKDIYSNKTNDISTHLEQISQYQIFRNKIISGLSSDDIYIGDLEKQLKQLENSFIEQIYEVKTIKPGFVTYNIDGLEEQYKYSDVLTYSIVQFKELLDKKIEKSNENNMLDTSTPFVKMVYGNSYYIGFILQNNDITRLKGTDNIYLDIKNPTISIKVKNIIYGSSDDQNTCVFFEVDSKLNELSSIRKITADIILSEHHGLKVQLSALKNYKIYPYNNVQIGLVNNNWVNFVDVDIIVSDETYAIIENKDQKIGLYDYYVLKPNKVTEGQIVK